MITKDFTWRNSFVTLHKATVAGTSQWIHQMKWRSLESKNATKKIYHIWFTEVIVTLVTICNVTSTFCAIRVAPICYTCRWCNFLLVFTINFCVCLNLWIPMTQKILPLTQLPNYNFFKKKIHTFQQKQFI